MSSKPARRPLGANLSIGRQLDTGAGSGASQPVIQPSRTALESSPPEKLESNSISLPAELWEELRAAAHARRRERGGRTSVSALIREFLESHREEWRPKR
jgi:hypothetical protein